MNCYEPQCYDREEPCHVQRTALHSFPPHPLGLTVFLPTSPWCFLNLGEAEVDTWLFNGWTLTVAESQYFRQSVVSFCSNCKKKEDSLINEENSINPWLYNIYIRKVSWQHNNLVRGCSLIYGRKCAGKCSTTELYSQPLILSSFFVWEFHTCTQCVLLHPISIFISSNSPLFLYYHVPCQPYELFINPLISPSDARMYINIGSSTVSWQSFGRKPTLPSSEAIYCLVFLN